MFGASVHYFRFKGMVYVVRRNRCVTSTNRLTSEATFQTAWDSLVPIISKCYCNQFLKTWTIVWHCPTSDIMPLKRKKAYRGWYLFLDIRPKVPSSWISDMTTVWNLFPWQNDLFPWLCIHSNRFRYKLQNVTTHFLVATEHTGPSGYGPFWSYEEIPVYEA